MAQDEAVRVAVKTSEGRVGAPADDGFVIAAHHPDRLRRPPLKPGSVDEGRKLQARLWNAFRTLELIPPAYWLRRLHARLFAEPITVVPLVASVHLWRPLPLPPRELLDGACPDVVPDVLIETDAAVWSFVVAAGRYWDLSEAMPAVLDAGAWFAGRRPHHAGVIDGSTGPAAGRLLQERYARSRESASLRGSSLAGARIGVITWEDLEAVLGDCAEAPELTAIERALAAHALVWCTRHR